MALVQSLVVEVLKDQKVKSVASFRPLVVVQVLTPVQKVATVHQVVVAVVVLARVYQ